MDGVSPATLVQSLSRPAFVVDTDRSIYCNERFRRVGEFPEGKSLTDLAEIGSYFDLGFQEFVDAVERVLGGRATESQRVSLGIAERRLDRLHGEVTPMTEDGAVVGALAVWEDERKTVPENYKHERFYQAFERHGAPMLLIDPESGRIEDANDAAVSFYGYSYETLVSMRIQKINRLSAEEVALERERARRESRNHFNFEHELASGEIRPVEVHSSPIQFDDEELLFSIIHDISEREQHKDALEREKAFTDSALNTLTDIFYVTDQSGGMRRWNNRLSAVTGYDDSEIEEMTASELFADVDADLVESTISELVEGDKQITRELSIETKSGEKIPYEFTASLLTADGETLGIAGTGRDISERKAREQNLRQLRRAIEATPHGVFLTDTNGIIEYVNPAFEAMTGYPEEEVLGRTPRILKSGEHDESFYRNLWETITAGEIWQAQIINERRSGERYHAHQTIAPITEADGTVSAFVAIQTDITGRKERQQHLRVLSRVLRHNLQNDLSVIRSYAEQTEGNQQAVDRIVGKIEEMLETAQKEREISTVLAKDLHQREIDVTRTVEQAITDVTQRYPDADIQTNISEQIVAIAAPQLKTAITELVENAVVHNDGVEITVSVHSTGDAVEIRICDDGTGIPESERDILETGTEIDPLYHGTGLGLWLVYWIVRRIGGTLTFAENEPSGSIVTISLERGRTAEARGYAVEQ